MRKLFAAAGAVALALTMTACGSSGGSGDAGKASGDSGAGGAKEVGVTTWWSAGSEKDGFEALSKVFKEQHPDITLKNLATSGGGGTNAKQKLAADLAAKNPPDTYQSHAGAELSADIASGYVEDVSSLYDEFKLREAFPKSLIDRLTVDGKIYSVPSNIHRANVVWANPKVMEKAGLDPKNPPKDIKGWIADMEKLKGAGVKFPITVGDTWTQLELLETVLISDLGVDKYNGLMDGKTDWAGADVKTALEDYAKIISYTDPSLYTEDWEPAMKPILEGKSAYNVMGDWAPPAFEHANMEWGKDYVTFPVPGNEGVFDFLADSFTMPVGAKHPEGTKAWLQTISSVEGQIAFNKAKGSIPSRSDLTPEQIKEFSGYQQSAMESFGKDTIVSSIAHGAALPLKATEAMKAALGKFMAAKDVDALQKDFVAAVKSAV
ncbi:ABC transporter substrate-binding protein [Mobiluncus mulieris]|uniref:ABC transporter substrate-binding protein n=1 Tax=Mobiluncus mulieris TaxID=2052 RepID=UPI00243278DC|nr:ABC transporter substrate-binding protein [Mobiluncus mulieris]